MNNEAEKSPRIETELAKARSITDAEKGQKTFAVQKIINYRV